MPQMSAMFWLVLMIYFSIFYLSLVVIVYFNFSFSIKFDQNQGFYNFSFMF